jgi:hypothetical protein
MGKKKRRGVTVVARKHLTPRPTSQAANLATYNLLQCVLTFHRRGLSGRLLVRWLWSIKARVLRSQGSAARPIVGKGGPVVSNR